MAQKIKCETLPTPASILLKLQPSASSVSSRSVSAEIYFELEILENCELLSEMITKAADM